MRYLQDRISAFARLTTYFYSFHHSHKRSNQTHPPCSKKTPMSVFERPQKFRKSVLLYPVLLTGFCEWLIRYVWYCLRVHTLLNMLSCTDTLTLYKFFLYSGVTELQAANYVKHPETTIPAFANPTGAVRSPFSLTHIICLIF